MKALDKRLADLEAKMTPTERYLVYQEQLSGPYVGMFARTLPDGTERYVARDDIAADADGATAILIIYDSNLPAVDLSGLDSIQLPDNGRGDVIR
jgi:hypothetical protein